MQITNAPTTTAMLAKNPASASIAAANRSATGSLGGVNAEGGASESGGSGGVIIANNSGRAAAKRGRGRVEPHLGQNVDMWV